EYTGGPDCCASCGAMIIPFDDDRSEPAVHGYLHVPERASGMGVVLAHGAGWTVGRSCLWRWAMLWPRRGPVSCDSTCPSGAQGRMDRRVQGVQRGIARDFAGRF